MTVGMCRPVRLDVFAAMEPAPWERDDGSLKRSRMTCVFVAPCERRLPGFRIASTDGVVKVRNRWLTSTRALPRCWVTTTALAGSDDDGVLDPGAVSLHARRDVAQPPVIADVVGDQIAAAGHQALPRDQRLIR